MNPLFCGNLRNFLIFFCELFFGWTPFGEKRFFDLVLLLSFPKRPIFDALKRIYHKKRSETFFLARFSLSMCFQVLWDKIFSIHYLLGALTRVWTNKTWPKIFSSRKKANEPLPFSKNRPISLFENSFSPNKKKEFWFIFFNLALRKFETFQVTQNPQQLSYTNILSTLKGRNMKSSAHEYKTNSNKSWKTTSTRRFFCFFTKKVCSWENQTFFINNGEKHKKW